MELTRIIHPVGQGGFYTETFMDDNNVELFNMVYDCGSETDKPNLIESCLNKHISNVNKRIDAVFISHLHEDHINGLDFLLSHSKVKYLFLPQLTSDMVIEAFLYNSINSGGFKNTSNTCISKLIQRGYNDVNIIEINEMDDERQYDEGEILPIGDNLNGSYNSGTSFTINRHVTKSDGTPLKWLYIPFNSPIVSKKGLISNDANFASTIDSNGKVNPNKIKDLIEKEGIDWCKAIYTYYFGRLHNSYSMTLFSGIRGLDCSKRICCLYRCVDCCCHEKSPNFLFTGDFMPGKNSKKIPFGELLRRDLDKRDLWRSISGVQVPHHGSRDNIYSDLYHYPCVGYISVGSRNTYHHPNVDTLVSMQKEYCKPVIVSEDLASEQKEKYLL